jgi:hypothetical protein
VALYYDGAIILVVHRAWNGRQWIELEVTWGGFGLKLVGGIVRTMLVLSYGDAPATWQLLLEAVLRLGTAVFVEAGERSKSSAEKGDKAVMGYSFSG